MASGWSTLDLRFTNAQCCESATILHLPMKYVEFSGISSVIEILNLLFSLLLSLETSGSMISMPSRDSRGQICVMINSPNLPPLTCPCFFVLSLPNGPSKRHLREGRNDAEDRHSIFHKIRQLQINKDRILIHNLADAVLMVRISWLYISGRSVSMSVCNSMSTDNFNEQLYPAEISRLGETS